MVRAAVFAVTLAGLTLLAGGHSALGLMALVPALGAGLGAAILGCVRPDDRLRLVPSAALGIVALGAVAANGFTWGLVVAAALTLGAYLHARAGGAPPRAAAASLAPGIAFALVAASAVLAGGALAG